MPSKKKNTPPKAPLPYVLAIYDFDPYTSEELHEGEPGFVSPDVDTQLRFKRGERLAVLSEEIDWWIYCRSLLSGEEGYVPSVLCAPVCEVISKTSCEEFSDIDVETKRLVPCMEKQYVDLQYFPNAPDYLSKSRRPCACDSANMLSKLSFWWMSSLIVKGYKRPLEDADLWALSECNEAKLLEYEFQKQWKKELCKLESNVDADSDDISNSADSGIEDKVTNGISVVSETEDEDKSKEDLSNDMKIEDEDILLVEIKSKKNKNESEVKSENAEEKSQKPKMWKAVARAFGRTFFLAALLKLFHDALVFVNPYILGLIIDYVQGKGPQETWRGYVFAVSLFAVSFSQSILINQYFYKVFLVGLRVRSAIICATYRKMLVLSNKARTQFTSGEMVNLMSVDANRLQEVTTYMNMMWSAPFQILVALYFLYNTMGWSIFAGVAIMVLLMPINVKTTRIARKYLDKQMKWKDSRTKIMNEILNGIRVLKLYAWEGSFIEKVRIHRKQELKELLKFMILNATFSFTYMCVPFMVSIATFTTYVLSGNELTAHKAFVGLSLFNILKFPLGILPNSITSLIQSAVALKRISNFLQAEELDPSSVSHFVENKGSEAIKVEHGTFSWNDQSNPTLKHINLTVGRGKLVAIVGQVGCGKSSLLSALLGEMQKHKGNVVVNGSIAYVPQQAWIQNETLQENILFGRQYISKIYNRIVDCCALRTDLEILPGGDLTEIGEKGINLSGGQKQRVSLARATYADADIYLFDDPLSAVDAHVGKHIFDHVIGPDGLLQGKARVLVTHSISFLPEVDEIIVLRNGKISEVGTYEQLLSNDGAFAEFLRTYLSEEGDAEGDDFKQEGHGTPLNLRKRLESKFSQDSDTSPPRKRTSSRLSGISAKDGSPLSATLLDDSELDELLHKAKLFEEEKQKREMIKEEKAEIGHVKLAVFLTYIKSLGMFLTFLIVLFSLAIEVFKVASTIWLARWSSDRYVSESERNLYLAVYGAFGSGQMLAVFATAFTLAGASYFASKHIHDALLVNVMHCPMLFFETTPTGRIINRFSSDINTIDQSIPGSFKSFLATFNAVIGCMAVISYSTPIFMAVLLPLAIFYIVTQRFYVATSRQLKRLESVKKSPIFNHFLESINGASSIRAYKQQHRFIESNQERLNENQVAYFPSMCANRWLSIRLHFVGNCIIFFASLFAILQKDKLSPGLVGLSISYALQVTGTLNWMVRMSSELETNIVAIERVKEYTETPNEAPWIIPSHRPPSDWPSKGVVKFENYGTRYRSDLDLVLTSILCDVSGCEMVGIVGRTGAGKSSIALALFRVIEAAEGKITIDGINISDIGLHDLRSKLTIIPQDPVLFSGTLRFNLDPSEKYNDDEIWRSLEVAHLKEFVLGLGDKLEHEVSEGGENLSVGQRQLVCLARALLRKTKVLVLDEATAAVDMETDDLIQETIRTEFQDCTILTIAHRLNTIMDYNRIMVLDKGNIIEFDTPANLLANKDGIFYTMAKDAKLV